MTSANAGVTQTSKRVTTIEGKKKTRANRSITYLPDLYITPFDSDVALKSGKFVGRSQIGSHVTDRVTRWMLPPAPTVRRTEDQLQFAHACVGAQKKPATCDGRPGNIPNRLRALQAGDFDLRLFFFEGGAEVLVAVLEALVERFQVGFAEGRGHGVGHGLTNGVRRQRIGHGGEEPDHADVEHHALAQLLGEARGRKTIHAHAWRKLLHPNQVLLDDEDAVFLQLGSEKRVGFLRHGD